MIKKLKSFVLNNFLILFTIYYCTLFLDTSSLEIDYPPIEIISKIIRYAIYILLFIRLISILPCYKEDISKAKWKEKPIFVKFIYFLIIIMMISLTINFITTKNKRMLFLMLLLMSSYKTDYRKIIKSTMNLQIILTSVLVLLSILGITQNYIVPRGKISRYSLGFVYTTNLAQMIAFSSILYLYNQGSKIKIRELFIMQLMNAFAYFITDSRTEFIMLQVVIGLTIMWKALKRIDKEKILKNAKKI